MISFCCHSVNSENIVTRSSDLSQLWWYCTNGIMFTTDWLTHTQLIQNCAYNWRDDVYHWSNNTHTTNGDLCVQQIKYWYITDQCKNANNWSIDIHSSVNVKPAQLVKVTESNWPNDGKNLSCIKLKPTIRLAYSTSGFTPSWVEQLIPILQVYWDQIELNVHCLCVCTSNNLIVSSLLVSHSLCHVG